MLEIVAAEPEGESIFSYEFFYTASYFILLVEAMTKRLVKKAYDLSLDRTIDSPFARLAKENDKMWGGGMPDDITVIAARVLRKAV